MDPKVQILLYEESLYTLQHQWKPNSERDCNVKTHLDKVFAEAQHADTSHKVQAAKPPVHLLKVIVEEPTQLHSKMSNATSCTAHLIPKVEVGRRGSSPNVQDADGSCADSPRSTASPTDSAPHRVWGQAFKLGLTNERGKDLLLNFWKKSEGSLRDSKNRHSSTVLPLSGMEGPATLNSYLLQKKKNGRYTDKGKCAVSTSYTTKLRDTTLSRDVAYPGPRVYELLLQALVEREHSEQQKPLWDGKLSEEARYILLLYECQVDLPASQAHSRKWCVYMKEHNKKQLNIKCFKDLFTETVNIWTDNTEKDELKEVMLEFRKQCLASLRKLGEHFPASSTDAVLQLSETLWLLMQMDNSKIIKGSSHNLNELIEKEITEAANAWYSSKRRSFDTFRHQKKDFMQAMVKLCELIDNELSAMGNHHNVFQRVLYLNYRAIWCKEIEAMLATDIRTSMEETQTTWEKADDSVEDRCKKETDIASAMHSLYISLQELNQKLDRSFKDQPKPLATFHEWFLGGINAWVKTVHWKTESIVRNALEKDTLQWDHPSVRHSSSTHDLLHWFVAMRDFWSAIAWPDPDITNILVCKLIEEICDASISYTTLLRERLVLEGLSGGNRQGFNFTDKICVGLCSIYHLRHSLRSVLSPLISKPQTAATESLDGQAVAAVAVAQKADPSTILESGIDDLTKEMEDTLRKMAEHTKQHISSHFKSIASDAAVKVEDDSLYDYYNNNLKQLYEGLSDNIDTFKTLLYMLWEVVLKAFSEELEKNRIYPGFMKDRSGRSSANYPRMQTILQKLLQVFKADVVGIKMESLQNDVYKVLEEQLELRQKSSAELINLYHQKKAKSQLSAEEQSHGVLHVECRYDEERAVLIVQLLSASDLPNRSSQKIRVKLLLCLDELSSQTNAYTSRTITYTGRDNGHFNETFEFALSAEQRGCPNTCLVFELREKRVLSETFLGEALLDLSRAAGVTSEGAGASPVHVSLPLLLPSVKESQVLHILQERRDPEARRFIKNMLKRDKSQ